MEKKVGLFSGHSPQHAPPMTMIFSLPFSSDRDGCSGVDAVVSLIQSMISKIHLGSHKQMPDLCHLVPFHLNNNCALKFINWAFK
jgi:hypothetical protein